MIKPIVFVLFCLCTGCAGNKSLVGDYESKTFSWVHAPWFYLNSIEGHTGGCSLKLNTDSTFFY